MPAMTLVQQPNPALPLTESSLWDVLPSMAAVLSDEGHLLRSNRAFDRYLSQRVPSMASRIEHQCQWLNESSCQALLEALAKRQDFRLLVYPRAQPGPDDVPPCFECEARWLPLEASYSCVLHDVARAHHTAQLLEAQAQQFKLLANNVPVLIAYYDAINFTCQFANSQYACTFGWDENSIIGRTFAEIIGEEAAAQIQPQVNRVLQTHKGVSYERQLPTGGGGIKHIEVNLLPHLDNRGIPVGGYVLISDITRHRVAEQALRESEERLAKFMQASAEGIVFHQNGVVTDANPPICELLGYELNELLGRRTLDFIAPDHLDKVATVMAAGQETTYESVLIDKLGRRLPVEFIVRTITRHGEKLRMTVVRDLRDREAARARIHHQAHHDALTGLPNRTAFMERLDNLIAASRSNSRKGDAVQSMALLFIDLDHFKRVNDSLGHLAGDVLLRTVAKRITGCLRQSDLVARFGGDEFMVLLPQMSSRAEVEDVASKLLSEVEAPVYVESWPLSVTPSVGIALFPEDGTTADALIKNADTAMYQAKARGRASCCFFTPEMASNAYADLVMEGELAQALERGEFELYFQPQVRADRRALVGVEALIRWHHPTRGLLMPDDFIPVAEQQRLMLPIGQWVLREAARAATLWQQQGLQVGPVAVNLSNVQFQSGGFVEAVATLLAEEGTQGAWIEFELTERMLMDDLPGVQRRLRQLSALGILISVDDFGTGYSSLGHLKELPIDKMKIDRSFVHDLPTDSDSAAIACAIIQMARSLGITVMAEGVETEAQCKFLANQGCHELQGDLISKPLSAADLKAWVLARGMAERDVAISPSP
jgi:diguanylate cyclase (GGDEF)-like protein/PAS domain S-box-containing protein